MTTNQREQQNLIWALNQTQALKLEIWQTNFYNNYQSFISAVDFISFELAVIHFNIFLALDFFLLMTKLLAAVFLSFRGKSDI